MLTAVCLPHHLWLRVLTALDGSVNLRELGWDGTDDADFLKIVMDQDPALREEIMQAWDTILRSDNIPMARIVCNLIDSNSEVLGILPNTPLYDQMVITGITISNMNNEDSPFQFHADLKKKRSEPVVIKEAVEIIDGINISVDSSYLKSLAHEATLERDLPDHMKFFTEMVAFLEKSSESDAFKRTVQDLSGMAWDTLFSGALLSGYLKDLLRIDHQSLAKASIVKVRFVKIIDILVNSAKARPNNQDLYEFCLEPFLTILASIQGCVGGKDEGIHGLYNAYMEEKNFDAESASSIDYINSFILTSVEEMFSGNNLFFKRLTGLKQHENVPQAAHHSVYVKSLIHEEVGLPRDFSYDPNTRQLLVSLIEKSRQHVVTEFTTSSEVHT